MSTTNNSSLGHIMAGVAVCILTFLFISFVIVGESVYDFSPDYGCLVGPVTAEISIIIGLLTGALMYRLSKK